MKISAIIVAGGSGKRYGGLKQFSILGNKPVYRWSVDTFKKIKSIKEIILVVPEKLLKRIAKKNRDLKLVAGGKERFDSVQNALKAVSPETGVVLIHDAARPLVSSEIVKKSIAAALKYGAAAVAASSTDTVKFSADSRYIKNTLERKKIYLAQTPQVFKKNIITRAYKNIDKNATDDSFLVEKLGLDVRIVKGNRENMKITEKRDLKLLNLMLRGK